MAILESPSACIAAEEGVIAKAVLMPGDPLRAKFVAEHYLENPVCFNTVRNMLGYTGIYKGRKLSVMGHGMGVPSAGLYAHELYNFYGVDTIIRIGSAGGIGEDVKVRDVVLAMGASTNSHFADQYRFPGQLCATADFRLLRDAVETAEAMGVRADVGQVFTADQFYNDNPDAGAMYRKFGILALEMETAGLYWTAQRLGKRALSLLTISDHIFTGESLSAQERQDSFHEMMEIALEKAYEVWGDKPRWKEARQRLKDAGIKVMETGFYETEAPACGCGAKLDHRDFGPNGKIDRLTYYISVKPEDVERAKELLADLVKPEHVAPQ